MTDINQNSTYQAHFETLANIWLYSQETMPTWFDFFPAGNRFGQSGMYASLQDGAIRFYSELREFDWYYVPLNANSGDCGTFAPGDYIHCQVAVFQHSGQQVVLEGTPDDRSISDEVILQYIEQDLQELKIQWHTMRWSMGPKTQTVRRFGNKLQKLSHQYGWL